MKPAPSALQVRGLTKRFNRLAVDALDLTVRAGEFYALVGPNGAGKTTTLRMVAGLLRPDAGSVSIFGIDAVGASSSDVARPRPASRSALRGLLQGHAPEGGARGRPGS